MHLARDLGRLVPVKIEACEIPFGFRLADTIDLSAWDGAPRSRALDPLIDALEGRIGRDAAPDRKALMEYEATWRRFGAHPLKDFALNGLHEGGETPRFGLDPAPPAAPAVTSAERDFERFGIAASEDVEEIEAYIGQYGAGEPLWALKAKKRLSAVKALLQERAAEARAEAAERERKAEEERQRAAAELAKQEEERRRAEAKERTAEPPPARRVEQQKPGPGLWSRWLGSNAEPAEAPRAPKNLTQKFLAQVLVA